MRDYRIKGKKDPEKARVLIEEILERGQRGADLLKKEVDRAIKSGYPKYQQAFYARAKSLGLEKYRAADKGKIADWQEQVNSIRRDGVKAVTKEKLAETGKPALKSLQEALTVSRSDVLDGSKALSEQRDALVALVALQARCVAVQADAKAKALAEAKAKAEAAGRKWVEPKAPPETPEQPSADEIMQREEVGMAMLGAPLSPANRSVAESIWRNRDQVLYDEALGLIDLTVMRSLLGLNALSMDVRLCNASRGHSTDMVEKKFFAHESPVAGKTTPWDRARLAGTSSQGECIAAGQKDGPGANLAWFLSPGHHVLILGRFRRAGLGKCKRHWTLMLGN